MLTARNVKRGVSIAPIQRGKALISRRCLKNMHGTCSGTMRKPNERGFHPCECSCHKEAK